MFELFFKHATSQFYNSVSPKNRLNAAYLLDTAAAPAIPKYKLAGQNRNYKFLMQTVRRSAYNAKD